MIGRTISHYRIVSQLASGGMGVVYRAEDTRLGREVAIKFVSDDFAHDHDAMERLRAEARAASALNHGSICTIHDIGDVDGHPFIVMELMKGMSLRERLADGPLKMHQLIDMGIEIADALHAAHSEGIIHRDIKPGNIFLTERGHVKVLDFGLAKLMPTTSGETTAAETLQRTQPGITLGTVSYMSPEQATGEELDGRTDIFSLGVVLYECATGQHPFPGRTSAVTFAAILTKAPLAPVALNSDVPLRLQEVINNCLEKDRELRYQSAADLCADLKRVRRDLESGHSRAIDVASISAAASAATRAAHPDDGTMRSRATAATATSPAPVPAVRSRAAILAAAGALAAVLIAGAAAYLLWPTRPPAAAPAANSPSSAIQERLALAGASLQSGNYRSAAAYAAEALALDPGQAQAKRIQDEARAMLQRFDAAVEATRRSLAAGDLQGAAQSLDTARAIDPGAPGLATLGTQLDTALRRSGLPPATPQRVESPAPQPPRRTVDPTPSAAAARPATVPAPPSPAPPPVAEARSQSPVVPAPPAVPAPATPEPPSAAASAPPATEASPAGARSASAPPVPAPARPAPAPPADRQPPPAAAADRDDAAVRRLVADYARAIETKNLALFRQIKPNLSAEEERRLQQGFRAVTSQQVELTVASITHNGDNATVALRRRDTIQAGGRQQSADSRQTLVVARQGDGWVIIDIR